MRIGFVGAEKAKFTEEGEEQARELIRTYLLDATLVISGKCHLGGIDIWAIEEAKKLSIPTIEFAPEKLGWQWYKERNQKIAEHSDRVICITVNRFPENYIGMRFNYCYHCNTDNHIKSGGCWTVKYAKKLKRDGLILTINQ